MSSAESLRELIIERLTAAAEEIFRVVERTVVQYEEEIDRQRRLLDITWKPEIKLHRIDLPQQYVWTEEEVLRNQQLCNQEMNSSLEQEEPEPPQTKEELEEPEPPQIKEEPEEPEPPQMKEEQQEPEPPQMKEEPEEPEPPQMKEEPEEPEPPQMKEEPEEPEPPQTKEDQQHILRRHILERILNKFEVALSRTPLDLDFMEFVCRQEMYLLQALARHVDIPQAIIQAVQEVFRLVRQNLDITAPDPAVVIGLRGRPRFDIDREQLAEMLQTNLSVPCIAKLLGVSERTIFRRMKEFGLSVSELYSSMSDEELDNVVVAIKNDMPTAGYRMVRGRLLSMGIRVQWARMIASMHRVDSIGILSRLAGLGCTVRRTYSVRGPLSLVHVDTNHKLIRYNIVIFGGVDGYSRKVMYLNASTNNRASTAFGFFLEGTQRHGVPLRVRGDQGVENVQIARFMFSVRGTDQGSFISGKSVHNQRIERLWRDVRVIVLSKYYQLLHSLENEGLLDISSTEDLFCVHYVILPRLKTDLEIFTEGWNHHPLRFEGNQSPEQLWQIGLMHTDMDQLEIPEEPDVDWEIAGDYNGEEEDAGIVVPDFECPLSPEEVTEMQSVLEAMDPHTSVKEFYLLCREFVALR